MKEKLQKIKEKVKALWIKIKKLVLSLLAAAILTCLGYFVYTNRKLIRAVLRFSVKCFSKGARRLCKRLLPKKK